MERHFALPVLFSAAFHGALLFGFQPDETPLVAGIPRPVDRVPDLRMVPAEEEIPIPPDDAGAKSASPALTIPVISSQEPVVVEIPGRFTIPLPPVQVAGPRSDATSVPLKLPTGVLGGEGNGVGHILSAVFLDQTPRTRFQAAPVYPFEARTRGSHGEVLVEFLVDEDGHVREPRVVRSSDRVFEEPTLRAVAKWRFEPGRRNGKIVRFRMSVPVQFSMN